jgi:hypothetical protein
MTHDELLEEIDDRFSDTCDAHCESCSTKNFPIKALRAVVELHKPISSWVYEEFVENHRCSCDEWNEYDMGWPCDTIQAIEKELQ